MMAPQSEQRGENCKLHIRRRSETAVLLQWLLHCTARDGVQGTVDILQRVQHEWLVSAVCVTICSVCDISAVCVIYLQCVMLVSTVCDVSIYSVCDISAVGLHLLCVFVFVLLVSAVCM